MRRVLAIVHFLCCVLVLLCCPAVVAAQPSPRTPNFRLKYTADGATNDNFRALDAIVGGVISSTNGLRCGLMSGKTAEAALHCAANGQSTMAFQSHSSTAGDSTVWAARRARGTFNEPAALQSGDIILTIAAQGCEDAAGCDFNNGDQAGVAAIEFYAAENYTTSRHGSSIKFFTVPLLSSTLTAAGYFSPAGTFATNGLLVGSAAADPQARFHIYEPLGEGFEVERLESETTGDNVIENTYQCKANTTDATPAACGVTFAIASGTVVNVRVNVAAKCTGGSSCASADGSAGYEINATCENIGGTTGHATGSPTTVLEDEDANWTVSVDCNNTSDQVIVTVTGAANTNITWMGIVRAIALTGN